MKTNWELLIKLIDSAIEEGIFPSASVCVWHRKNLAFSYHAGYAQLVPTKRELKPTTLFDLASLTKPLACGLVYMSLVEKKRLNVDDALAKFLEVPPDKKNITIAQLLSHTGGFPAWRPYYLDCQKEASEKFSQLVIKKVLDEPLEYPAGKVCIYSDLGYILLWAVAEKVCDKSFDEAFYEVRDQFDLSNLIFVKDEHKQADKDFAATENCAWRGRVLVGEVHDENAWAMGRVSAHSGLFGTAEDACKLGAKLLSIFLGSKGPLKTETVKMFWNYRGISTYKLGWDSPSATGSSAGKLFSKSSVGHVGFTGTSIWLDPTKELVCVLLTNRIHPTRSNEKIKRFRPIFHDTVIKILEGTL